MKYTLIIILFVLGTISAMNIAANAGRLDWFWDRLNEPIFVSSCTSSYMDKTEVSKSDANLFCVEVRELLEHDSQAPITLANVLIESQKTGESK